MRGTMTTARVWVRIPDRARAMTEGKTLALALYGERARYVELIPADQARVTLGYTFAIVFGLPTRKPPKKTRKNKRVRRH
jgi:hypothetical protein